jgi:mannose-1-phosphate guanylyltransferase
MLVLPGDHIISPVERFAQTTLTGAAAAVELDSLVTYGILPRHPAIGYGYIQRGEAVNLPAQPANSPSVYKVVQFREKPSLETAKQYVSSGEYFWNGGIFLWQLSMLQAELDRQLLDHAAMAKSLGQSRDADEWDKTARQFFPKLKKISIDYGIMEHARSVATVAADFSWDDIGSWSAVAAHLANPGENAADADSQIIPVDAKGNLVFAPGKRVALIGIEGVAVVASGDEILVCRLDRDQDVKKVAEICRDFNKLPAKPIP